MTKQREQQFDFLELIEGDRAGKYSIEGSDKDLVELYSYIEKSLKREAELEQAEKEISKVDVDDIIRRLDIAIEQATKYQHHAYLPVLEETKNTIHTLHSLFIYSLQRIKKRDEQLKQIIKEIRREFRLNTGHYCLKKLEALEQM